MAKQYQMMLRYCMLLLHFLAASPALALDAHALGRALQKMGFENIRVLERSDTAVVAFENAVYRWDVAAISAAMDVISQHAGTATHLQMLLLRNDIPRVLVAVDAGTWLQFRTGELPASEMGELLHISEATHPIWKQIKGVVPTNRHAGKTDLVVYPQLAFKNTLLSRLYEVQFNVAPALELSLWRGMSFTAQMIIPLYNQLGYEGNFVRPGQFLLAQQFMVNRLNGRVAAGNFSNNRYGVDLQMRYLLPGENMRMVMHAGYTGSSHFFDGQWKRGDLNAFTWKVGITRFIPSFNVELEGGFQKYIYGDSGMYASGTRWFGETAFGFYAQLSNVNTNGGFFFSFPFPMKKRNRDRFFRIAIPRYQDMYYNAGTEFLYGQTYRAGTGISLNRDNYRANYLKNEIFKK